MSYDIETTLFYYKSQDGVSPQINDIELLLGDKDADGRKVKIQDIRDREQDYSLENNGFQVLKHDIPNYILGDVETIKSLYYPAMADLLKRSTGAKNVIIFNHQIRDVPASVLDPKTYMSRPQGPARRVHIDQTPKGAEQLIGMLLPPEAAREVISATRWIVINAWRPIKTIRRDPLAVMDATSVPDSDLVPLKRIMPNGKEAENYLVKAGDSGGHKWYYLHKQRPDEVLAFKIFDSDASCRARRTPHSSFVYPGTEKMPTRESIEVRAVVYY